MMADIRSWLNSHQVDATTVFYWLLGTVVVLYLLSTILTEVTF